MKIKLLFLFLFGLGIAGLVSAQAVKPKPVNQQAAINQALKSGKLTPKQAAVLRARAAELQKNGKRTNVNNVLTPAEKARLAALAKQKNVPVKK